MSNLLKLEVNNSQFIEYICLSCQHVTTKETISIGEDDMLNKSINTLEGRALWRLMECEEYSIFYPQIKETIATIAESNNIMLHSTIMAKLSDWLRVDIPWTRDIFLKITDNPQSEIYKYSVNTLNYLNNSDFEAMVPTMKRQKKYQM
jgi:hypothetical protein